MQKISKKAKKKNAELKILPRENTFGLIEYIQEQNRVTKIGQKFLTNTMQKNKNTDMN